MHLIELVAKKSHLQGPTKELGKSAAKKKKDLSTVSSKENTFRGYQLTCCNGHSKPKHSVAAFGPSCKQLGFVPQVPCAIWQVKCWHAQAPCPGGALPLPQRAQ